MGTKKESECKQCRQCAKLGDCVDLIAKTIIERLDRGELVVTKLALDVHFANIADCVYEELEKRARADNPNAGRLKEIAAFSRACDEYSRLSEKEKDFSSSIPAVQDRAVQVLIEATGNERAGASVMATFFDAPHFASALAPAIRQKFEQLSSSGDKRKIYQEQSAFFNQFMLTRDFKIEFGALAEREADFSNSDEAVKLQAVDLIVSYLRTLTDKRIVAIGLMQMIHDEHNGLIQSVHAQFVAMSKQENKDSAFFAELAEFVRDRMALAEFQRLFNEVNANPAKDLSAAVARDETIISGFFACLDEIMPESWKTGGREDEQLATSKGVVDWLFVHANQLLPDVMLEFIHLLKKFSDEENKLAYYFTLYSHLKGKKETAEKRTRAEARVTEFFRSDGATLPQTLALMDESAEVAESVAKFAFCNQRNELFQVVMAYLKEKGRTDERYKAVAETAEVNQQRREQLGSIAEELTDIIAKIREMPSAPNFDPSLN